jgi:DNA mismatch repair protein MSH5
VPARAATIGLTDRVQVRIFSRETAAIAKSTFMLDLHQAALMLTASTERTLLILDEFGKGTHFADGLAFLASFVLSLAARGRECPLLLVATHFTELLDLPEMAGVRLQHKTMQALVEPATANAPESVLLLYKVIDGRCGHSFATAVARAVGAPECIVARAEAIQALVKAKQPITALADDAGARSSKITRVLDELRALNINSKDAVAAFLADLSRP